MPYCNTVLYVLLLQYLFSFLAMMGNLLWQEVRTSVYTSGRLTMITQSSLQPVEIGTCTGKELKVSHCLYSSLRSFDIIITSHHRHYRHPYRMIYLVSGIIWSSCMYFIMNLVGFQRKIDGGKILVHLRRRNHLPYADRRIKCTCGSVTIQY